MTRSNILLYTKDVYAAIDKSNIKDKEKHIRHIEEMESILDSLWIYNLDLKKKAEHFDHKLLDMISKHIDEFFEGK